MAAMRAATSQSLVKRNCCPTVTARFIARPVPSRMLLAPVAASHLQHGISLRTFASAPDTMVVAETETRGSISPAERRKVVMADACNFLASDLKRLFETGVSLQQHLWVPAQGLWHHQLFLKWSWTTQREAGCSPAWKVLLEDGPRRIVCGFKSPALVCWWPDCNAGHHGRSVCGGHPL